ncbi:hypothetical protein DMJ13_24585 [halophilic archaeon]|nr:hypothetical protein DMJ13_24585 [halophilic archaeon]
MTDPSHPFSVDRIEDVAEERDVDEKRLDETLAQLQSELDRSDGGYEYSSEFNFGWQDDRATYFYGGDDLWTWLGEKLSVPDEFLGPARDVHYRTMVESAAERDEKESVEEMLADGNEPLVVTNTSEGPPSFGQGDSV